MDKFLRELDASIAKMSPEERREAIEGLRGLLRSLGLISFLKGLSKFTVMRVLGDILIAMQTGTSPEQWFQKAKLRAEKLGCTNVGPLFQSL